MPANEAATAWRWTATIPLAFRTIPKVLAGMVHNAAGMVRSLAGREEGRSLPLPVCRTARGVDNLEFDQMKGPEEQRARQPNVWELRNQGAGRKARPLSGGQRPSSPSSSRAAACGPKAASSFAPQGSSCLLVPRHDSTRR